MITKAKTGLVGKKENQMLVEEISRGTRVRRKWWMTGAAKLMKRFSGRKDSEDERSKREVVVRKDGSKENRKGGQSHRK